MMWNPISTAPPDTAVMTKIDDADGCRNEQIMTLKGRLWFAGEMYVYYQPTHWRALTEIERLEAKNETERKAIAMMKQAQAMLEKAK